MAQEVISGCAAGLTVIIPFLNEGMELERTVHSIRSTASPSVEIMLINDGSDDGYDYSTVPERYHCRYIFHHERKGVAASRDEGVAACRTEHFLLLDAHMEFYREAWDVSLISALRDNPESILCCQTRMLWESRENAKKDPPSVFGAYLALDRKNILKCVWNHYDSHPEAPVIEVPVVLGAAYAAGKDHWQKLHGLKGLVNYGMDEELISLKCWMEGGRCLLLKDIQVGHVYRQKFPYVMKNDFTLHNKLLVTELFFEGDMKRSIVERLQTHYGGQLLESVRNRLDWRLIAEERDYLKSISRRELSYFLFKNSELRG